MWHPAMCSSHLHEHLILSPSQPAAGQVPEELTGAWRTVSSSKDAAFSASRSSFPPLLPLSMVATLSLSCSKALEIDLPGSVKPIAVRRPASYSCFFLYRHPLCHEEEPKTKKMYFSACFSKVKVAGQN
jgi:hypothetical protein